MLSFVEDFARCDWCTLDKKLKSGGVALEKISCDGNSDSFKDEPKPEAVRIKPDPRIKTDPYDSHSCDGHGRVTELSNSTCHQRGDPNLNNRDMKADANLRTPNQETNCVCSHEKSWCTPRWESFINFQLLSAGMFTEELFRSTRSVVLASGSMAPISPLCNELHLLPPALNDLANDKECNADQHYEDASAEAHSYEDHHRTKYGRLQVSPEPLEADHVIDLEKQLLAVSVGCFTDGTPLVATMKNYLQPGFHEKLGNSIATIIDGVPKGGVLGK